MARHETTAPTAATTSLPVRSLAVEVVEGPDAGRRAVAAAETLAIGTAHGNELTLTDPTVSRFHLALERRADGVMVTDHGSTNGTTAGGMRLLTAVVAPGTLLRLGRTVVRVTDGADVAVTLHAGEALAGLRGRSPAMRRVMAEVQRAAQSDVSVLVIGESGTGKELVAHALHALGRRSAAPFVTVDCGAMAPTLMAGELFGHEKGSFTGAERQHAGAFERAHRGTLFLDEVGELPVAQQAALLGVLERRRFRRVGGTAEIQVDTRVIAATNRDLRAQVNDNAFRLDLYYRLAVVVLRIPPLRERREDVPLLVEHFLRDAGYDGPLAAAFPPATMSALAGYSWPGNVRELRNLVESTVAMGRAPLDELGVDAATTTTASAAPAPTGGERGEGGSGARSDSDEAAVYDAPYRDARAAVLADFERRYLARLMERAGGNVTQAARDAQMDRSHLADLLRRHGLR